MLQQFDLAIQCYVRSLEQDPGSPETPAVLLELSQMHERRHQLEAAVDYARRAAASPSMFEQADYQLAVLQRRQGAPGDAAARLEQLLERRKAPRSVQADAWYQLAAIEDKAGRFDKASVALAAAKKLLAVEATDLRHAATQIAASSRRMLRELTAGHFQRWHAAEFKPLAGAGLALLTGYPRSGTTLLEQVLDSHPALTSGDELPIFYEAVHEPIVRQGHADESLPEMLEKLSSDRLEQLRAGYWSAMEGRLRRSLAEQLLLDKNPAMTQLLPTVARVFPEMQLLFAVRDPRDVVISCYLQQLPLNTVSVNYLSLEQTVRDYVRIMQMWQQFREQIQNPWIEVRYEDTVADLESQARRVLNFLGLPWDDAVLEYRQRAHEKHVHSPTYVAVTQPVYTSSIGRWRSYADLLAPYLDKLKPWVETFGYDA